MANRMVLEVAPDIKQAIRDGTLSMADSKSAAYFVQECILDHLLDGKVGGYLPITSQTTPRQWDGLPNTPVEENLHSPRRCFTASASANWLPEEDRQIAPTGLARKTSWATSLHARLRKGSRKERMNSSWPTSLTGSLSPCLSRPTPSPAPGDL
jgi:hypothetical protein